MASGERRPSVDDCRTPPGRGLQTAVVVLPGRAGRTRPKPPEQLVRWQTLQLRFQLGVALRHRHVQRPDQRLG